jgi:dolichol kinase
VEFIEWKPDYTALVASYGYVLTIIAIAEFMRRIAGRPMEFTRKFIHVGVGMWVVGTVLLFETWYLTLIPPITFVVINAFAHWKGTFKSMDTGEKGYFGTIYFPISFAAVLYFFWSQPVLTVASLMPLTWGDAMAAILGQRYGHYRYRQGAHSRSLEGSIAMFFWSWASTFAALLFMPFLFGRWYGSWLLALFESAAVALVCTIVEALSPWGIDNLTIPAAAVLVLNLLRNT